MLQLTPLYPTVKCLEVRVLIAPPVGVKLPRTQGFMKRECFPSPLGACSVDPAQAPLRDVADVGRVSDPVRGGAEVRGDHAARVVLAQGRVDGLLRVLAAPVPEVHLEVLGAAVDHVGDVGLWWDTMSVSLTGAGDKYVEFCTGGERGGNLSLLPVRACSGRRSRGSCSPEIGRRSVRRPRRRWSPRRRRRGSPPS